MPLYQPELVPVLINGAKVYLRGAVSYDVNTGVKGARTIRDILSYGDIVARSCVGGRPTVTYTDVNGTRTIAPTDYVQPLVGSSFVVK